MLLGKDIPEENPVVEMVRVDKVIADFDSSEAETLVEKRLALRKLNGQYREQDETSRKAHQSLLLAIQNDIDILLAEIEALETKEVEK